jgi:hypothetical protein
MSMTSSMTDTRRARPGLAVVSICRLLLGAVVSAGCVDAAPPSDAASSPNDAAFAADQGHPSRLDAPRGDGSMAFIDVREVGAVADGSARHDGEPGAIPDGSRALPPPHDPAFPSARYLPSAEHNDLRPRPGDDVTFAMAVFSESGVGFRIDEDGALWALGAWFTPRLNGAPVWRMLSGVDRTGRIFFEARREGSVAVNAFLARREGVYAVVTASTDARIEGVAVPWLQGVAPGLDRFMVAFDRVGAVRWMRRVGGGVGAALASRGDEIALIVGVHAGEGGGSDGTGLVPTSRGGEVIEVDLSAAGTTLRTRRLPAITNSPGPSAAVFHGDGRLTALNALGRRAQRMDLGCRRAPGGLRRKGRITRARPQWSGRGARGAKVRRRVRDDRGELCARWRDRDELCAALRRRSPRPERLAAGLLA